MSVAIVGSVVAYVAKECSCAITIDGDTGEESHQDTCVTHAQDRLTPTGWYTIERTGSLRADGGPGVSWYCTCYDGDEDRPTCEHIVNLLSAQVNELPEPCITKQMRTLSVRARTTYRWYAHLTQFGDSIVRAVWAENALKDEVVGAAGTGSARGVQGVQGVQGAIGPVGPLIGFTGPRRGPMGLGVQGGTPVAVISTPATPWPPRRRE